MHSKKEKNAIAPPLSYQFRTLSIPLLSTKAPASNQIGSFFLGKGKIY